MKTSLSLIFIVALAFTSCKSRQTSTVEVVEIFPVIITDTTLNDTDDPAIWYNFNDPSKSLILGTDKGDSTGGIFVFDLSGKLDTTLSIYNLYRPNNIDVEYGFNHSGVKTDIAVFTERGRDMIRVISLPDFNFIDDGGIPVFEGEEVRSPMGIALYKDKSGDIFAFVGRKDGPAEGYLHQYKLVSEESIVSAEKVRAFGKFSGLKEIEAIAVDNELGYVYYSDEMAGVRKYYADASRGNEELAFFATSGFTQDNEGISISNGLDGKGYIIVSDQQANKFHIFSREGSEDNPHDHKLLRIVKAQTNQSDGNDIINLPLNDMFPNGLFVAMSDNKTFQFYKWEDVIGFESNPSR